MGRLSITMPPCLLTGHAMQCVLAQDLPPLSGREQEIIYQYNAIRLPVLTELMQLPMATVDFDFSTSNQGATGWDMLMPEHELLLKKYIPMLLGNIELIVPYTDWRDDMRNPIAKHITQFVIVDQLAQEIPLDTIGWWLFTIRHWLHELARREAERKVKQQFPKGHVLVSSNDHRLEPTDLNVQTKGERNAAMNRFDAKERRESWRREMLYQLKSKRTPAEAARMSEIYGRVFFDGLLSTITQTISMTLFPGSVGTIDYVKSKKRAIRSAEKDLADSILYAEAFAIPARLIECFFEAYLKILKNAQLAGIDVRVKERVERLVADIMERLKINHCEDVAASFGRWWGGFHLSVLDLKGIFAVRLVEDGPSVIDPEMARQNVIKYCDDYIKGAQAFSRKYNVEVNLIRAFFNGEKEIWIAAAPNLSPAAKGYLKDMLQNSLGYWISISDQDRANILNHCQADMKYHPRNQRPALYIEYVKEMVAYSLIHDPSYDFYLKDYFSSAKHALRKDLKEGEHNIDDTMFTWRMFREVKEKAKKDFTAKLDKAAEAEEVRPAFDQFPAFAASPDDLDAAKENTPL